MTKFVGAFLCLSLAIAFACDSHAQNLVAGSSNEPPAGVSLLHRNSDGTSGIYTFDPAIAPQIVQSNAAQPEVQRAALSYVSQNLQWLIHPPTSLQLSLRVTSLIGKVWHSVFTVSYNGVPLVDRKLSLVIGALSGKPMILESNVASLQPNSLEASFSEATASLKMQEYVRKNLSVASEINASPTLIYTVAGESQQLLLAYEGLVKDLSGAHLWRVRVDASAGEVLDVHDVYESIGGGNDVPLATANGTLTALVHPLSSYDTLVDVLMPYENITVNGKKTTTDSLGRWSVAGVTAPYTITSTFTGPYNLALRKDGANGALKVMSSETPFEVQWTNANSDPAERDAFNHVNVARSYVRKLDTGLTNLDALLKINVNLSQTCNAFYDPTTVSLNFFKAGGQGCSNTGEITDVVFHEFGHRVTDSRYTQHGGLNIVDGSLGEGFADLVSNFIRDDPRIGVGFFQKGSLLRNSENTKKWPRDLNADIHISGEIISGAFWDLRKLIGHDTAERLFHMMGYLNPDGIGSTAPGPMLDAFTSVLTAVIVTDDDDNNLANGTPHLPQILKAFGLHNIGLSGFLSIAVDGVPDQDSLTQGYEVRVNVKYSGKVGTLDANSVTIHYTNDDWKHSSTALLQSQGGNIFTGVIPKMRAGSIVDYYASAMTNYADAGEAMSAFGTFLVGYRRISLDDAEQDRGWSLSQPGDQATTGTWTRDIPFGTYINRPDFIQQDTDHTPNGSYCYLTGNANKPSLSRDPSLDDVDNGATTLTTPLMDLSALSNPIIKYWYYYRNDAGSNPGLPKWATYISNDGGTSWKTVQNTNLIASGWTAFVLPVSDYVVPSSKVLVRFVASDFVGAIVEAGIDDFEVLEGPKNELNEVAVASSTFSIGSVFPNPTRSGLIEIPFSVGKGEHVVIRIKDVLGKIVATPLDQFVERGSYQTSLKLASEPAGTYWVQMMTPEGVTIRRFVISR